jgi:hypothetical protein
MKGTLHAILGLLLIARAEAVQGQFTCTTNSGTITIIRYSGPGGAVFIPTNINGLDVTEIGTSAFQGCMNVTSVIIPDRVTSLGDYSFLACSNLTNIVIGKNVTNIGQWAFYESTNLSSVYFYGNAPGGDDWYNQNGPNSPPFQGDTLATAYYLPCASGWETNYGYVYEFTDGEVSKNSGIPTSPWWQAIFTCVTNAGAITITGDSGLCGTMSVTIPASMNGLAVTGIASNVFESYTNLISVYFYGNAPAVEPTTFNNEAGATVYYSPAGLGWNSIFAGFPTVPWWQAIFDWFTNDGAIMITSYTGPGGPVSIPPSLNGLPVTSIATSAFYECSNVTRVTIPSSVTNIGNSAFEFCSGLTNVTILGTLAGIGEYTFADCGLQSVYVMGNAPPVDFPPPVYNATVFAQLDRYGDPASYENATVYYWPGTTGWSNTFAGLPALLWNPVIQTGDGSFGVCSNEFGFDITGTTNIPIAVEVRTNLARPVWTPFATFTLTNGSVHFSDRQWTNYPTRYYGLGLP